MKDLHNRLYKYEDQPTLLSPDAQTGLRKSITAALGERKGSTPSARTVAWYSIGWFSDTDQGDCVVGLQEG